jgi:hypothetical protein
MSGSDTFDKIDARRTKLRGCLLLIFTLPFIHFLAKEMQLLSTIEKQSDVDPVQVNNKVHLHLSNAVTTPKAMSKAKEKTESCVRLSTQDMGLAKFRIVVYQKQGGQQLVGLLVHYLQTLTYDEIVVIANEEGDNILEDTPCTANSFQRAYIYGNVMELVMTKGIDGHKLLINTSRQVTSSNQQMWMNT